MGNQAAQDRFRRQLVDILPQEVEAQHLLGHQVDGDGRRQRPAQPLLKLGQALLGPVLDI